MKNSANSSARAGKSNPELVRCSTNKCALASGFGCRLSSSIYILPPRPGRVTVSCEQIIVVCRRRGDGAELPFLYSHTSHSAFPNLAERLRSGVNGSRHQDAFQAGGNRRSRCSHPPRVPGRKLRPPFRATSHGRSFGEPAGREKRAAEVLLENSRLVRVISPRRRPSSWAHEQVCASSGKVV